MTPHQRRILLDGIDGAWAEEVLRDRYGELTADQIYYLTYLVSGNQQEAQRAQMARTLEEMRRKRQQG